MKTPGGGDRRCAKQKSDFRGPSNPASAPPSPSPSTPPTFPMPTHTHTTHGGTRDRRTARLPALHARAMNTPIRTPVTGQREESALIAASIRLKSGLTDCCPESLRGERGQPRPQAHPSHHPTSRPTSPWGVRWRNRAPNGDRRERRLFNSPPPQSSPPLPNQTLGPGARREQGGH